MARAVAPAILPQDFDLVATVGTPGIGTLDKIYRVKPEAAERERALMEAEERLRERTPQ